LRREIPMKQFCFLLLTLMVMVPLAFSQDTVADSTLQEAAVETDTTAATPEEAVETGFQQDITADSISAAADTLAADTTAALPEEAGDPIAELMAKGDALADEWEHGEAAGIYLQILETDSQNYEAAWKAGDELTEQANQLPEKAKEEKEAGFAQAVALCERAIAINPDGWEGHLYLAKALGRLALFRGGKEKINMSRRIREEVDKTLALNPESDLAYHILGRWHQNLANLSWLLKSFAKILYGGVPPGTNEEAVEAFQKAIQYNPDNIVHYLELARTYQYMGKKSMMIDPLNKVLELPPTEEDDAEYKEEAREMLEKAR